MKRFFLLPVLLALLVGAAFYLFLERFESRAVGAGEAVIEIGSGETLRQVLLELQEQKVVDCPTCLYWYARLKGMAHIRAGEFAVSGSMRPAQLLRHLDSNEVVLHDFTVVEGWNIRELLQALRAHDIVVDDLGPGLDAENLLPRLALDGAHAEGRFFPDTYRFARGETASSFLRRAHARLEAVLASEWQKRADGLPLRTPEEALILASIVEKETGLAGERALIAGVFINRLRKGMRLQTDPTVIYGLGEDFDGNLRRVDLRNDTPYNTYTRKGLPPTPIALPGRAALHAVLHPADTSALYFVARGDGSHEFSRTLEAHNRAVRRYQLKRTAQ